LHTVPGQALTGLLAMLTGGVGTALNGAFVSKAFLAFQEKLFTFPTALTAFSI